MLTMSVHSRLLMAAFPAKGDWVLILLGPKSMHIVDNTKLELSQKVDVKY